MELGSFEVALNVQDIKRSAAFYAALGFKPTAGAIEKRFLTVENGDCRITLYQGFLDPPVTQLNFWQGDIATIAQQLEAKGLPLLKPLTTDETGAASVMLKDPDGHPLFFISMPSEGE